MNVLFAFTTVHVPRQMEKVNMMLSRVPCSGLQAQIRLRS